MNDLLLDIEGLRDKWDEALGSRYYSKQLTALLAKHAKPKVVTISTEAWRSILHHPPPSRRGGKA